MPDLLDRLKHALADRYTIERQLGSAAMATVYLAKELEHPHIFTLIDSGESDGFLYYVMPAVEGESLRDRLSRENQSSVDGVGHAVGTGMRVT